MIVCGHHLTYINYDQNNFVRALWSKQKTIEFSGNVSTLEIKKKDSTG